MEKEKMNLGGAVLEGKKKKRKVGIGILSIVLVLVLLLGLSYAFFTLTLTGTKQNVIKVGKLSLNLAEENAITLENAVPTSIEEGLFGTPYHFTIENNGTVPVNYVLNLKNEGTLTDLHMFYYTLKKDGKIVSFNYLNTLENNPLMGGELQPGVTSEYDLYIWIDYNYTSNSAPSGTYQGKLELEAIQQKTQKLSNYILHACDGVANCTRQDGNTIYFQDGYHQSTYAKYIWYSGKLWVAMSYDMNGNVKMMTLEPVTAIPWGLNSDYQGSYIQRWMNEEFLPSLNNYENLLVTDQVWNYSRTVGVNLLTDIGDDKLITSPVGLLNSHDILMSGNGSNGMSQVQRIFWYPTQYLGNANSEGKIIIGGRGAGMGVQPCTPISDTFYGISPVVVLKSNVLVTGGTGSKTDPYRIQGDAKGKSGDLLNTRFMGEYVAFGDQVNYSYRITRVENGKTKISSTTQIKSINLSSEEEDVQNLSQSKYRYTTGTNLNQYLPNDTTYPLAYFLNHDFLTPSNGYLTSADIAMISTNESWYPGMIRGGEVYTKIRDSLVTNTATIGIPALGEMQMPSYDKNENIWSTANNDLLINNNGTGRYNGVDSSVLERGPVRSSMYLKSNVKIKSGSGTKYDPYILTLS